MTSQSKFSFSRRNLVAAATCVAAGALAGCKSRRHGNSNNGNNVAGISNISATGSSGARTTTTNCMVRGTLIMTPAGERTIESLQAGDLVITKAGAARPIKWVGTRKLQKAAGTRWQSNEQPVKVHASAIADNIPSRDVYLSQEHAIAVDGALVRVRDLVNGLTITLEASSDMNEIEYYHIELASHDVVMSSGLPIETLKVATNAVAFDSARPELGTTVQALPVLMLAGGRDVVKSRLRSAMSPWIDRRTQLDVIRDRVEGRARAA